MKLTLPIACLLCGIAIGWFGHSMRPVSAPVATQTIITAWPKPAPATTAEAESAVRLKRPSDSSRSHQPDVDEAKRKAMADASERQGEMSKKFTDVQRKKFETRFAKLIAELHLTPEQQQVVRDRMEKQFAAYGSMMGGGMDGRDPEKMKETMEALKIDGVDESLSGMLQGDQLEAYQATKAKDDKNRADSKALKDLGNITSVIDDLTQEQRDGIYQVLSEQALKNLKPQGGLGSLYEGMGIQMDDDFGMQSILEDHMADLSSSGDPSNMIDLLRTSTQKKIDDRVEALKPFMSETQLNQYRTNLQDKAAGMMNMFGGGTESTEKAEGPGN